MFSKLALFLLSQVFLPLSRFEQQVSRTGKLLNRWQANLCIDNLWKLVEHNEWKVGCRTSSHDVFTTCLHYSILEDSIIVTAVLNKFHNHATFNSACIFMRVCHNGWGIYTCILTERLYCSAFSDDFRWKLGCTTVKLNVT